jgi:hypothetical protein
MTAHSLLYFHHHGSSTSLSDVRLGSSPSKRTPLGTTSSSPDRRRQGTRSHVRFLLSNHVLHIEYVYLCMHDFVAR